MPMWYWICDVCRKRGRSLKIVEMCDCGGKVSHDPQSISFQKKEVLDNGVMTKSLERLDDIQEMMADHSQRDLTEREE